MGGERREGEKEEEEGGGPTPCRSTPTTRQLTAPTLRMAVPSSGRLDRWLAGLLT